MRVMKLVGEPVYARGIDLREGMLTKMTRSTSKVAFMFRFTSMYVDVNVNVLDWHCV